MRPTFLLSLLFAVLLALPASADQIPPEGNGKERNNGGDTPTNISGIIGSVSEKSSTRKRGKG